MNYCIDGDAVDELSIPISLLETLCDFACATDIHEKAQIDADSLATSLGVIIGMLKAINEKIEN